MNIPLPMKHSLYIKKMNKLRFTCVFDNLKYIIVIAKGKLQTLTCNSIAFMYILMHREQ